VRVFSMSSSSSYEALSMTHYRDIHLQIAEYTPAAIDQRGRLAYHPYILIRLVVLKPRSGGKRAVMCSQQNAHRRSKTGAHVLLT
jgi:hypothetical protein